MMPVMLYLSTLSSQAVPFGSACFGHAVPAGLAHTVQLKFWHWPPLIATRCAGCA